VPARVRRALTGCRAHLRQGLGDDARPLDGAGARILWVLGRGRRADAPAVDRATDATMRVDDRRMDWPGAGCQRFTGHARPDHVIAAPHSELRPRRAGQASRSGRSGRARARAALRVLRRASTRNRMVILSVRSGVKDPIDDEGRKTPGSRPLSRNAPAQHDHLPLDRQNGERLQQRVHDRAAIRTRAYRGSSEEELVPVAAIRRDVEHRRDRRRDDIQTRAASTNRPSAEPNATHVRSTTGRYARVPPAKHAADTAPYARTAAELTAVWSQSITTAANIGAPSARIQIQPFPRSRPAARGPCQRSSPLPAVAR
jgi:hypothetical protein